MRFKFHLHFAWKFAGLRSFGPDPTWGGVPDTPSPVGPWTLLHQKFLDTPPKQGCRIGSNTVKTSNGLKVRNLGCPLITTMSIWNFHTQQYLFFHNTITCCPRMFFGCLPFTFKSGLNHHRYYSFPRDQSRFSKYYNFYVLNRPGVLCFCHWQEDAKLTPIQGKWRVNGCCCVVAVQISQ